jgi:hypothetical protein
MLLNASLDVDHDLGERRTADAQGYLPGQGPVDHGP